MLIFIRQLFQRLAFGLWNQERRSKTCKHEEGKDFQTTYFKLAH